VRENRRRSLWREDRTVVNGWLAVPDSLSAEIMARAGFDSLTVAAGAQAAVVAMRAG
jgi:4-hydroxy-2-oxoheptanedioate aldolase